MDGVQRGCCSASEYILREPKFEQYIFRDSRASISASELLQMHRFQIPL